MFLKSAVILLALLGLTVFATPDEELCLAECVGSGSSEVCTFYFSIDIFAGETGYYRVKGCEEHGTQPTLGMKAGVKYIFDQTNITNWFHPLGFAYGPDGVYGENVELEPTVADPVSTATCDSFPSGFCQFPQYRLNGVDLCTDCLDDEDFGLDEYEGVYFSGGRDTWIEAGNFTVEVEITDNSTTEIFYFCHIHNRMSGRIKILNPDNTQRNAEDLVPIPYEYAVIDEFDAKCGTFNVSQFRKGEACQGLTFLCDEISFSVFGQCMFAIDCAMYEEMRTPYLDKNPTTTFMHQMIPHHQNAVNMAKILLKFNPPSLRCGTDYDGRRRLQTDDDEDFCHEGNPDGGTPAETLLWEIINGQNAQITFMRAWLEDNLQPQFDQCKAKIKISRAVIGGLAGLSGMVLLSMFATAYLMAHRNPPVATGSPQKAAINDNGI